MTHTKKEEPVSENSSNLSNTKALRPNWCIANSSDYVLPWTILDENIFALLSWIILALTSGRFVTIFTVWRTFLWSNTAWFCHQAYGGDFCEFSLSKISSKFAHYPSLPSCHPTDTTINFPFCLFLFLLKESPLVFLQPDLCSQRSEKVEETEQKIGKNMKQTQPEKVVSLKSYFGPRFPSGFDIDS